MVAKNSPARAEVPQELMLTRVFDAPRSLVFKVWIDPRHVAAWWGPHGFTNPVCELDVRPGGKMRIDMRGPDGTIYPSQGVFEEIVEPERIVFRSGLPDGQGGWLFEILNTVTFAENDGKTTLTLSARVLHSTDGAAPHLAGMNEGWSQTLERLGAQVATLRSGGQAKSGAAITGTDGASEADREIVLTRVIHAPRELAFEAWTGREHVAQWWGPNGFKTTVHEMNVRSGGVWRFTMHGPDGTDYHSKVVYSRVVKPERLEYSHGSDDDAGPPHFQVTVTFEDQGATTLVTLRMLFATREQRDHTVGFGAVELGQQTLAHLDEHVARMKNQATKG
jgi:uncharacterized protein YndB with AHSA1/START domain